MNNRSVSERKPKGSLLFETFVALMILSIGITSTLRVFSEALFVGTRNTQKSAAQEKMNHLLFGWFAYPGGVKLPDAGTLTLPLDSENASELTCTIESKNLSVSEKTSAGEEQIQAMKESQYYAVEAIVQKDQKVNLLDLETVIFQSKKVSS